MGKVKRGLTTVLASTAMVATFAVPTVAFASGADGGNFGCSISGVPGWGYVNASYSHPSRRHYATAQGKGRQTIWANAGHTANARVGRDFSGNKCWYGF